MSRLQVVSPSCNPLLECGLLLASHFFFVPENMRNVTFTILTPLKCRIQWHEVHSPCCATTTIRPQNVFIPKQKLCPQ